MNRALTSGALGVGLCAIGVGWFAANERGLAGAPELGDDRLQPGDPVVLSLGTVVEVHPDRAVIHKAPDDYLVVGTADWRVGEDWSMGGTWTGEAVEVAWVEEAPGRSAKKGLGVLGLLLCALILPVGVSGRPGALVERG